MTQLGPAFPDLGIQAVLHAHADTVVQTGNEQTWVPVQYT